MNKLKVLKALGLLLKSVNFCILEGIGGDYWWGGNLKGVQDAPIRLEQTDKLVYSPHAYPNSIHNQPWFSDSSFPDNMPEVWDHNWGYIAREEIAPVLVGEFGSRLEDPKDVEWFEAFIPYLEQTGASWTVWSLNPNSGDTGGILETDWRTPNSEKLKLLEPVLGGDLGIGRGNGETALPALAIADNSVSENVGVAQTSMTLDNEASETFTAKIVAFGPIVGDEGVIFDSVMVKPTSGQNTTSVDTQAVVIVRDFGETPTPAFGDMNGDGVTAELRLDDNWGTGFIARGTILNDSGAIVEGWSIAVTTEAEIENIWNAQILSRKGDTYLIGDVGYNEQIADGDSATWGFQATGNDVLENGDVII